MKLLSVIAAEGCAFMDALVRYVPGLTGALVRRTWLRLRFGSAGRLHIDSGCEFVAPRNMTFGEGVNIGRNSFFAADGGAISIGAQTAFNTNTHINASVGGAISIGRGCLIGPNVMMRTADHRYEATDRFIRTQGHIVRSIDIGDDVWIGANVVIVGGVTIGTGSVIGAGAVVTRDVSPFTVAAGVPAKRLKSRGEIREAQS